MNRLINKAIQDAHEIVNYLHVTYWATVYVSDNAVTLEHGWIMPNGERETAISIRSYSQDSKGRIRHHDHVRG